MRRATVRSLASLYTVIVLRDLQACRCFTCRHAFGLGLGGSLSNRVDGGFRATFEMKFHKDVADVMACGLCAYKEAFGDLGIAQPLTQQVENFKFAPRKAGVSLGSRASRSLKRSEQCGCAIGFPVRPGALK